MGMFVGGFDVVLFVLRSFGSGGGNMDAVDFFGFNIFAYP